MQFIPKHQERRLNGTVTLLMKSLAYACLLVQEQRQRFVVMWLLSVPALLALLPQARFVVRGMSHR
jgi:hypothetical protein